MQLASPKQLHVVERPREKLAAKGALALKDLELLQIIIGSGVRGANVTSLADQVLRLIHQESLSMDSLVCIKGLSRAKAGAIIAAMELGKRRAEKDAFVVSDPEQIVPLVAEFAFRRQEHLIAFSLDGAGHILNQRVISVGTLTNTLVHPREVYADAICDRAASVILVHNHPSGDPAPSVEDKHVTKLLANAGELLGVVLQDHIIVAGRRWNSLRRLGLL